MPQLISLTGELARPDAKQRRLLASGPGWKILLLDLRNGGEVPTHTAPGPITVHCLQGQADFAINDDWRTLRAGDLQTLEPNIPHSVKAPAGAVLIVHIVA
jgi:quercetin dioxygenase-like cupin family protein